MGQRKDRVEYSQVSKVCLGKCRNTGVTYKQAQMVAQMTAGKRFWHKPKSATVGTAQTKLAESL